MGLDLRGVHVLKKVQGKQEWRLAEIHPLIKLTMADESVYLQDGEVYDPSGKVLGAKERPGWFLQEAGKMTAEALRSVGFKLEKGKE